MIKDIKAALIESIYVICKISYELDISSEHILVNYYFLMFFYLSYLNKCKILYLFQL